MSSRNALCRVVIVGLGPYKVDNLYFPADEKSFWAYFNQSAFQFRTEECSFKRHACDRRVVVANWTRPLLAAFKLAYHNAVDFEIDFHD